MVPFDPLRKEAARREALAASFRWLLHFTDREPLQVSFTPMATHAEALACYPEAVAAEPIKDGPASPAPIAADDDRAILAWMERSGETDQATIDDVLRQCRRNAEALAYFIGRAGESAASLPDDRRTCRQCSSLRFGVCSIATPGGVVSASRSYRPPVDLLQRCPGYAQLGDGSERNDGRAA